MTRRFLGLLAGALALPALASCATFDTDDAAKVNDTSISDDDLQATRDGIRDGADILQRTGELDALGDPNGDLTRLALSLLISNELSTQILDDAGLAVTQEDLDSARSQLSGVDGLPAAIQEPIVFQQAANVKIAEVPPPDAATVEALYARGPRAVGLVCLRVVTAATEEEATAAASTFDSGGNPSSADGTSSQDVCGSFEQVGSTFGPEIADELLESSAGDVTTVPPTTTASWQVMQVLGSDAAADALTSLLSTDPGLVTRSLATAAADVSVDTQYGKWSAATQSVVAV